jgi:phosphoenolpyruvate carboxylase
MFVFASSDDSQWPAEVCQLLRQWPMDTTTASPSPSPQSGTGRSTLDAPLREDVRHLGVTVGELLVEQVGQALFEQVESTRTAAIARRDSGSPLDTLAASLAGLPTERAEVLIRAFSTYFQMVNIAERVHRIRRRRQYQRGTDGAPPRPQPDGLVDALVKLKSAGVSADELLAVLGRLDVEPVFTAHPTEAMRRSLLVKEQEIVRCLVNGFDDARTPTELRADWERLRMAMTAGWQTSDTSAVRMTVGDELEHVGFYIGGPLYLVVPVFYELFEDALDQVYGISPDIPRLLRFATWVGGDMDGNPNVGADTIAATLSTQRSQVIDRYVGEVSDLATLLSQTTSRASVSNAVLQRAEQYRERFPAAAKAIRPRHADMPYRVLLTLMRARLRATQRDLPDAYPNAEAFLEDIDLIADSLSANRGLHAGWFQARRLRWRVRTFGFHLARLDLRQDSRIHTQAVSALLNDPDWAERSAEDQAETLTPYAAGEARFPRPGAAVAARTLAVFDQLAQSRERYGAEATGLYIISMAQRPADVLAVLSLARQGGLAEPGTDVPLDIAPLFETVDDLKGGPDTLRTLLANPAYRKHLAARGDRQYIMLGYSDSGKDGGTLASRWGLQRAQVELLEVAAEANIKLSFFHGRGGSASRGGGRVTPALMASPRGSVGGVFRVTEQGEVIHRKYAIRALALRELEQSVSATLRASLRPRLQESREEGWKQIMAATAAASRDTYRAFVTKAGFVDYFRSATPIDVIERMTLGSRPSRRGTMKGVESLRAIPWVFAWTQCRAVITGWYGLGSALEKAAAQFGEDALLEMARDWAFMRSMLADVDMVLAKCDLDIAETFSKLAGPLHDDFFPLIRSEFDRTVHWVLRLRQEDRLLASEPRLAQSIRLRNPYVDPISLMQVDLLARWRAGGSEDDTLLRTLVATVNGVSQGLQNTG